MGKILSVVIPMYNSEEYIEKSLDSLILDDKYMQMIEILVINAGSTDRSAELVRPYEEKYPDTIRLISQENGGLGAAVDAGIEACQGKYFKVLDADGWFLTDEWKKFVHTLLGIRTVDVIVSGYGVYDIGTDQTQIKVLPGERTVETVTLGELMQRWDGYKELFVLQAMTYRTEFYLHNRSKWVTDLFWRDDVYHAMGLVYAKKVGIINSLLCIERMKESGSYDNGQSSILAMCMMSVDDQSKTGRACRELQLAVAIKRFIDAEFIKKEDKKSSQARVLELIRELKKSDARMARKAAAYYMRYRWDCCWK